MSRRQNEAIGSTWLKLARKSERKPMESVNITQNLPESAFFSAEEKVQLLSGNCPRHLTKEKLKEWLSHRKGTAKDGCARSDATKAELSQRY